METRYTKCLLFKLLAIAIIPLSQLHIIAQNLSFKINENGHARSEPNMDIDTSGHFIAVWQDLRHSRELGGDEDGFAIYGQKFEINCILLGYNFRIDNKENT